MLLKLCSYSFKCKIKSGKRSRCMVLLETIYPDMYNLMNVSVMNNRAAALAIVFAGKFSF